MRILKKSKKGLSEVISTLIILVLTLVIIAGLWIFVNEFVLDKLGTAKKCFGITENIEFGDGTCHIYTATTKELQISLNRKELKMDGVLISVKSSTGESKSFKIMEDKTSSDPIVKEYNGDYNALLNFPEENEGKTYVFNLEGFGIPKTIELVPIIEKEYCPVVDSFNDIPSCS